MNYKRLWLYKGEMVSVEVNGSVMDPAPLLKDTKVQFKDLAEDGLEIYYTRDGQTVYFDPNQS